MIVTTTGSAHTAGRDGDAASAPTTPTSNDGESTSVLWWVRTVGAWLLLLVLAFVLCALVLVPRATGAQTYTVLTGSMEPAIAPGALVVVRPTSADELAAGDVVTFQPYSGNPAVVTHRIAGIYYDTSGQMRIYTQGDANNTADDWTLVPEQIRGKLWYSVPQLGRVNVLLSGDTRALAISVVAGGLIVYAAWMFGSGLRERSREKKAGMRDDDPLTNADDSEEGTGDDRS